MTIEKLSKGRYRIRQQIDGKRYNKTLDHKPTQKEALMILSNMAEKPQNALIGSVGLYVDKYVDECEKSLKSPSTVRGYRSIMRNMPAELLNAELFDLTEQFIQNQTVRYARTHSEKSTKNMVGLLMCVIRRFNPSFHPSIKVSANMCKVAQNRKYEPTTADIERILERAKHSRYSVPIQLACLGLRRGEVIALTLADLSDQNVLTINKALSMNDENVFIQKPPKTAESIRTIVLPSALADEIRQQGYIFAGNPHTINEALHRFQDELGIQRFTLHTLRHFSAAYLHKAGFTDEQVRTWHGWSKGSSVLSKIYLYDLDGEQTKPDIAKTYEKIFEKKLKKLRSMG